MSISILPIRVGHLLERPARKPRRRAVDEVELLRLKKTWADLLIKTQRVQLDDADRKLDDADRKVANANERREIAEKERDQAEAVIRLRDQTIADLKRRLDIACQASAAADLTQAIDTRDLRDNYAPGVRTLQQAHCIGPVLDPGRVTQ